jgi:hypothetical protein
VLTGAKQDDDGTYHLRAGGTHFLVDYKFVRVISCRGESTCFSVVVYPDIPRAEAVAAALLQLKNNPRLFEKWRTAGRYVQGQWADVWRHISAN